MEGNGRGGRPRNPRKDAEGRGETERRLFPLLFLSRLFAGFAALLTRKPAAGWLLAAAAFLAGAARAQDSPAAGLRWERTTVELRAAAGAEPAAVLEARYPFLNAGAAPVEIESLQSDCGCVVAELKQRRYDPGEGGEIVARFTVGERVGREEKRIVVQTRGGSAAPAAASTDRGSAGQPPPRPAATTLTLVATIPELLRLRPALVTWRQGEEPAARTITVEAPERDWLIKRLSVTSSQALFRPELRTLEEGRRYELTVRPQQTALPLLAHLPITGEFGDAAGTRKTFTAYAAVQAAAREAADASPGKPVGQ